MRDYRERGKLKQAEDEFYGKGFDGKSLNFFQKMARLERIYRKKVKKGRVPKLYFKKKIKT